MDQAEKEMVQRWIEEALQPLVERIEQLEEEVNRCAALYHYHDNAYASIEHVERSEGSFEQRIRSLRNDLSTLEYQVGEVERKAERAQNTADSAIRSGRGW